MGGILGSVLTHRSLPAPASLEMNRLQGHRDALESSRRQENSAIDFGSGDPCVLPERLRMRATWVSLGAQGPSQARLGFES